jgi:hypothetical protein
LAPFLSLRRGERWRREAATEWGMMLFERGAVANPPQHREHAISDKLAIWRKRCFGLS